MLFELWGATDAPRLNLPDRTLGYLLLGLYLLVLAAVLYRHRTNFRQLSSRQWLLVAGLALASLTVSQIFPISFSSNSQLPPLGRPQNPIAVLLPFGAVPFILTGAILNPVAAIIVGFSSGLSRGLWQTHTLLDPFHFAGAAFLIAKMLRQNYFGFQYRILRQPIIAGGVTMLALVLPVGLATYAYADGGASWLAALDLALSTGQAYAIPLAVEGILGGLVVSLLLIGVPQLRGRAARGESSPVYQSLNSRLLVNFFIVAFFLTFGLLLSGFTLATRLSTDQAVEQMVQHATIVSEQQIEAFRDQRLSLLAQFSAENEGLLRESRAERQQKLEQLYRVGPFFRALILVDDESEIVGFFNSGGDPVTLSDLEEQAVAETLITGAPFISPAQPVEDDEMKYVVSMITAIDGGNGVLIGRVPDVSFVELVDSLEGNSNGVSGFILDEQMRIIAHPDPANVSGLWTAPEPGTNTIATDEDVTGTAFESLEGNSNTRQLVYFQTGPNHPWTIVLTQPYEVVLRQAVDIAARLATILLLAMGFYGTYLLVFGRSITRPVTELARATRQIASGGLDTATPIATNRDDEIGHLSRAFGQMQVALKQRLDELSLLLSVSREVSKSIDINHGMPSILRGALRRTGGAGVRVVVLNPSGRQPLTFGEGAAETVMADFDRQVMSLVRKQKEVILSSPSQVYEMLSANEERLPIRSMIALPLATHDRFQGIFWLSYRQAHEFDQTELDFLRTLTGQASVLVENARLFATAEGGRRRLAAVLSSTSDAVIVTDQTERILLINPALEQIFGVKAADVVGRPVRDVIEAKSLVEALTNRKHHDYNVEIPLDGGRVLFASPSTIYSNDGQEMGRVALLHDITYLKELDEMKSEFVATVSHDLRSPLTFMRGYATMLPMIGALDPTQADYVEKILGGIEQMSTLVNNLLDLGRLEAGIDLIVSRFRVEEILASVASEYREPAESRGIRLAVRLGSGVRFMSGDMALIRQAVANLVSNAVKYAPGSGKVILTAVVRGEDQDAEVLISVSDKGPGIAKKDQLRLFEKFYRIKRRETDGVKGSGLGLALVKSIAERHGGRTWCKSEEGQGSTFFILLPLNRKEETEEQAAQALKWPSSD